MDGPRLASTKGPVVYVAELGRPELAEDDRHHLQRVLRLRPGDPVVLADGRGSWRPAGFAERPSWIGDVVTEARPDPLLTLSVALPKGDRADWLMQKATEIGFDTIVVMESDHSVVRWNAQKAPRHRERFTRIIRSASSQSRRAWLPHLRGPVPFAEAAAAPGSTIAVPGGGPPGPGHRNVLIGPEGGWSRAEEAVGLPTLGLGAQVLRVETAAVAAGTLLVALRSGVVLPRSGDPGNALCG